jgi:phosphopantetheinyl transferase
MECGQPADVVVAELVGELSPPQWAHARSCLSSAERERFELEVVGRAERFLAGRYLLRAMVAQLLDCALEDVDVSAPCRDCGGEHGAPQVKVGHAILSVSLSHSGSQHVAALSREKLVGIDIELPREGVDLVEWTSREALSKLDGGGLGGPERSIPGAECATFMLGSYTGTIAWASAL